MNDKAKIIVGLVVFLVLAAFPIWYALASGASNAPPKLEDPVDEPCIEPKEIMAAKHMQILDDWRDAVVRGDVDHDQIVIESGRHMWQSESTGAKFEMSLTRTCMGCHQSQDGFCKKCHDYASVRPYCWDCHTNLAGK